jgi:hypothetical protein
LCADGIERQEVQQQRGEVRSTITELLDQKWKLADQLDMIDELVERKKTKKPGLIDSVVDAGDPKLRTRQRAGRVRGAISSDISIGRIDNVAPGSLSLPFVVICLISGPVLLMYDCMDVCMFSCACVYVHG